MFESGLPSKPGKSLAFDARTAAVLRESPVPDFSWPGASGTNWWVDPREELVVVFMAHTPGPMRWKYRQMINALVYQALAD